MDRDIGPSVQAIREVATGRRQALLAAARRRAAATFDAEDIVQHAIQRALERAEQLRDPSHAEAWLTRIVRNLSVDERRRRDELPPVVTTCEALATEPTEEPCHCVLAQLTHLRSDYSDILRRVIIEGKSVTQVAAELGISANNAMVRLHRARHALRKQLRTHCGMTTAQSCSECGCLERGCCQ